MEGDSLSNSIGRTIAQLRASARFQRLAYVLVDVVVVLAAVTAAYAARFEGAVPPEWAAGIAPVSVAAVVAFLTSFALFGLYNIVLKYAGIDIIVRLAAAVMAAAAVILVGDLVWDQFYVARAVPLSVVLLTAVFMFLGGAMIRSFARLQVYVNSRAHGAGARVLIVGAGDSGSLLLRDIVSQPGLGYNVVGFLDDDPRKVGRLFRGVRVLAGFDALSRVVAEQSIDEVFVAMPSATVAQRRRVLDLCNATDAAVRVIPGIAVDTGEVGVSQLRKVSIEDLLGRDPVEIDVAGISRTLAGKSVAVTGAAGSIGSELCRQIMLMGPRELHLLEIDESRLYESYLEFCRCDADVPSMHVCDIRNERKVAQILRDHKVDVVFHAAAYKHVPLMEISPDEAVTANVGGTRSVLRACLDAGARHFVLISTDKAVDPSSVMGATKSLAERLTFAYARKGLRVSVVRFGNVLGSRGSVVPLFEEQLRLGGPIRVTHPDITRYFMTIPEAVRLVLQAQALSEGGELYVLEMGEPVRIVDLARKMVSLSGARVDIVFVGLRPGEKLHEKLVHDSHQLVPTACDSILRLNAIPRTIGAFESGVDYLLDTARAGDCPGTVAALQSLVPDYGAYVAESSPLGTSPIHEPRFIAGLGFTEQPT